MKKWRNKNAKIKEVQMMNKREMKKSIQTVIKNMMDKVMDNVLIKDPFIPEKHHAEKPLYAALVPDEIFKGSHFERRFVTPFGNAWEELGRVAGNTGRGSAERQKMIEGDIDEERLRRIQEILNSLEHPQKNKKEKPDWRRELEYVLDGNSGKMIPCSVLADLYLETREGKKYAFELKAPLPNSDQTKVSKEKILKLYAMDPMPVQGAFFALPYNPYGNKKADYNWSFPKRWFDMINDEVVLIGNEFWDFIGGDGTYDIFLEAIEEMGVEYKEKIYKDFLGIEPPRS